MKTIKKLFKFFLILFINGTILGSIAVVCIFIYYGQNLPDIGVLENYQYPTTTRLYSGDGILLKEYAEEKRIYLQIDKIPDVVKQAFISAEDKNFYTHKGIDLQAIFSAGLYSVYAVLNGRQMRGGSTITQQVVKNILLTNERKISRKIKEAILSYQITKRYTKDQVLEIYLNYIFLGNNSYGVAAATLSYFNKSIHDITLQEAAVLASLPKAPAKLNPANNKEGAITRRNWVIEKMYENNFITKKQKEEAQKSDLILASREKDEYYNAGAFSEDTRKKLLNLYDEQKLLNDGLVVTTTIIPNIQTMLDKNLKDGLETYDVRHGFRGELGNLYVDNEEDFYNNWPEKLLNFKVDFEYRKEWELAVVLDINKEENKINIGLLDNRADVDNTGSELLEVDDIRVKKNSILFKDAKWLIKPEQLKFTNRKDDEEVDPETGEKVRDFVMTNVIEANLNIGSVIFVKKNTRGTYFVKQFPKVNGAAVVLDVNTGKVLAMVGGYMDSEINFNRVTQANRQTGSIIKPLVYLAAFENGYDGTDKIMDEEILLPQGEGNPPYKPKNFANKYYGVVTLRKALQSSYNVSAVRLASQIGLNKVAEVMKRFGVNKRPKRVYSMVLGSLESKLINVVNAYGMIVNGGKYIQRETIEKVQDRNGKTIYKRDNRDCNTCNIDINSTVVIDDIEVPFIADTRKSITDPATAYQITSILEGVVKYGTAWWARSINKIIGGKTGTSNDFRDAWFIGFSPDIILGVYVGFDDNTTLGVNETGSRAAVPIFTSSMKEILKNRDSIPFRVPENITLKRIDMTTGQAPTLISNQKDIIFEAFKIDQLNKKKVNKNNNTFYNEFDMEQNADDIEMSDDDEEGDIFETKEKLEKIKEQIEEEQNKQLLEESGDLNNEEEFNEEKGDIFDNIQNDNYNTNNNANGSINNSMDNETENSVEYDFTDENNDINNSF